MVVTGYQGPKYHVARHATMPPQTIPDLNEPYPGGFVAELPANLGGATPKSVLIDNQNQMWLFKPQTTLQTLVDMAAARVAQVAGVRSPIVHSVDCWLEGQHRRGSIQPVLDIQGGLPSDLNRLTPQQWAELQEHQVVDWLLGNVDAHRGQFLILRDGTLVGIDKSQSLRFFPHDRLGWAVRYWPVNTRPPVYIHLARLLRGGAPGPPIPPPLPFADAVDRDIPDGWLRLTWHPVVSRWPWHRLVRAAPLAWLLRDPLVEVVLDKIVQRKHNLSKDFARLYRAL